MIITLKSVDSTNSYALQNFDALEDKTLIVALSQTQGRGRHGRKWFSPPGLNFYGSYILKNDNLHIPSMSRFASLSVLETLKNFSPESEFKIKWPNDIYAKNRNCEFHKISGILSEMRILPNSNKYDGCVIGIGVNLNMTDEIQKIHAPATSIKLLTARNTDIANFAEMLLKNLNKFSTYAPELLFKLCRNEDILIGKNITIISEDASSFSGLVKDYSIDGAIIISDKKGNLKSFYSGNIIKSIL